jgi:hypothetical protein
MFDKSGGIPSPCSSIRYVMKMRPLVVMGLILAVLGLVALAVPTFEGACDDGMRPWTLIPISIRGGAWALSSLNGNGSWKDFHPETACVG